MLGQTGIFGVVSADWRNRHQHGMGTATNDAINFAVWSIQTKHHDSQDLHLLNIAAEPNLREDTFCCSSTKCRPPILNIEYRHISYFNIFHTSGMLPSRSDPRLANGLNNK